jgi:hypothetical protein
MLQALANHMLPDGWTVDTSPYIEGIILLGEMSNQPQIPDGTIGAGADSTYMSDYNYVAQLESMGSAAVSYFPHTSVSIGNNFLDIAAPMQSLSSYMTANRVAWEAGDTSGYSAGQNVNTNGFSFGQALYYGLLPPSGNPYDSAWTGPGPPSGGTPQKGLAAYIGEVSSYDMCASCTPPSGWQPYDTLQQTLTIGYTHTGVTYLTGQSFQTQRNWIGTAGSPSAWNANPGHFGGILDYMYANPITNTSCPTQYTTGCNTH